MTTPKDGQVVLSRGTQVVAALLFSAITSIGGFGLHEIRSMRNEFSNAIDVSEDDRQTIRDEVSRKFDVLNHSLSELVTQQAVTNARLDDTDELKRRYDELTREVTSLRIALVELNRPDRE